MAYRPKSLEDFDRAFHDTVAAGQDAQPKPEAPAAPQPAPAPQSSLDDVKAHARSAKEISGAVQDFARSYTPSAGASSEAMLEAQRMLDDSGTLTMAQQAELRQKTDAAFADVLQKPLQSPPAQTPVTQPEPTPAPQPQPTAQVLHPSAPVKEGELSGLMDDYYQVMHDDAGEEASRKSLRKRRKDRKRAKQQREAPQAAQNLREEVADLPTDADAPIQPPVQEFYPPEAEAYQPPVQESYQPEAEAYQPPVQETYQPEPEAYQPPAEAYYPPEAEAYQPPVQETYQPEPEAYQPPAEAYYPPEAEAYQPPVQETYQPEPEAYQPPAEAYQPPVQETYPLPAMTRDEDTMKIVLPEDAVDAAEPPVMETPEAEYTMEMEPLDELVIVSDHTPDAADADDEPAVPEEPGEPEAPAEGSEEAPAGTQSAEDGAVPPVVFDPAQAFPFDDAVPPTDDVPVPTEDESMTPDAAPEDGQAASPAIEPFFIPETGWGDRSIFDADRLFAQPPAAAPEETPVEAAPAEARLTPPAFPDLTDLSAAPAPAFPVQDDTAPTDDAVPQTPISEAPQPDVPAVPEPAPYEDVQSFSPDQPTPQPPMPEAYQPQPPMPEAYQPQPPMPDAYQPQPPMPEAYQPQPPMPEAYQPQPPMPDAYQSQPPVQQATPTSPATPARRPAPQNTPEPVEEEPPQKERRHHGFLRVVTRFFLTIIFFVMLLATVAVGLSDQFIGVNTGSKFLGRSIFTATETYEEAGIKAGDLVIGVERSPSNDGKGASVIYTHSEGKGFSFGKVEKKLDGDRGYKILGRDSEGNDAVFTVERKDILAIVDHEQTVHFVGYLVQFATERFVVAFSILAGLTFLLLLIIVFALRRPLDYEDEYYDELAEEEAQRKKKK